MSSSLIGWINKNLFRSLPLDHYNMKKNALSFTCVDNFLDKDSLESLQKKMLSVSYAPAKASDKVHYGYEHHFAVDHFKNDPLLKKVKDTFHSSEDLKPVEIRAHLRHNTAQPHVHRDGVDDKECFSFLLYVKGDSLMYNGTGFCGLDKKLSSYIGFAENRAIFFNAGRIWHTDLQALGESSPRYSLNIFYHAPLD